MVIGLQYIMYIISYLPIRIRALSTHVFLFLITINLFFFRQPARSQPYYVLNGTNHFAVMTKV